MKETIYLDHNANTPLDPRVCEAINRYLSHGLGNPSSLHAFGRKSRGMLTRSRDVIAQFLCRRPDEIIFTSGGTEGANLFIRGLCDRVGSGHIITSGVEHPCVLAPIQLMEERGFRVSYLNPGLWGAVHPEAVRESLQSDTKLIALMAVNNETGVKTDVAAIAQIARENRIPFFVDAVALLGKEHFTIPEGVAGMCFSGQKVHATPGAGFCFIDRKIKLAPFSTGGGQEFGRRSGTENLPGIVGLAEAIAIIQEGLSLHSCTMQESRDRFEKELQMRLIDVLVNGEDPRVVNTSNLYFPGIDGETFLTALDMEGVAASHGSACQAGGVELSPVLLNMGLSPERVGSSIRFSFARTTTQEEVTKAVEIVERVVNRLRR
ncbi:MAG: cysteine desulfurase family protein [Waddliaceae bacterium]